MYNEHEHGYAKRPKKEVCTDETRIPNERPLGWAMEGGEGMAEGRTRPGVMVYLELRNSLNAMSNQNKGKLFQAILDYAACGAEPEFKGMLAALWPMVKDKIDRDGAAYDRVVANRKKAINTRWWKRYAEENGIDPNDQEAKLKWIKERMENERREEEAMQNTENTNVSSVLQAIPTAPSPAPPHAPPHAPPPSYPDGDGDGNTETETDTWLSVAGAPAKAGSPSVPPPACAGETPTHTQTEKEWYGEYGNVRLSPAEVNALRRELGDGWEGMVNRLSEYMKMHGKSYSDHYAAVRSFARNSRNNPEKERETLSDKSDQYTDCFPGSVL